MSIEEQLKNDMIAAMKSRDEVLVNNLRFLRSALANAKIQKGIDGTLSENEAVKILRKELEKRKETLRFAETAGREDLKAEAQKEIEVISKYLPAEMSDNELTAIIEEVISQNPGLEFGPLIGKAMARVQGRASGDRVARILREAL